MKQIQIETYVSRYAFEHAKELNHIKVMIKEKMVRDLAWEILDKVEIEETNHAATGDKVYRLRFYLTTQTREARIVGAFVDAMESLMREG
jgi:hypothetical protein